MWLPRVGVGVVRITLVGGVRSSSDGQDGVQFRWRSGSSTGAQCLCLESQSGDGAAKFPDLRLCPEVLERSAVTFNCRWKAGAGSKFS